MIQKFSLSPTFKVINELDSLRNHFTLKSMLTDRSSTFFSNLRPEKNFLKTKYKKKRKICQKRVLYELWPGQLPQKIFWDRMGFKSSRKSFINNYINIEILIKVSKLVLCFMH